MYERIHDLYKHHPWISAFFVLIVSVIVLGVMFPPKPTIEGLVNGAGGVSLGSLDREVERELYPTRSL